MGIADQITPALRDTRGVDRLRYVHLLPGVTGAGTDADPYVGWQATLEAMDDGGCVVFTSGVFETDEDDRGLVMTQDAFSMIGRGKATVLRCPVAGATVLTIRHATDYLTTTNERTGWTVRGFMFDGGGQAACGFEPKNVNNSSFADLAFRNLATGSGKWAVRTRRFLANVCQGWRVDANDSESGQAPTNGVYLGYDEPGMTGDNFCTVCDFSALYIDGLTGTALQFGQVFGAVFVAGGIERCNQAINTVGPQPFDMLFLGFDFENNTGAASVFDGYRSSFINCNSVDTLLELPSTTSELYFRGGELHTVTDDGQNNTFDGLRAAGGGIVGTGSQKGRIVRSKTFTHDLERPHAVEGFGYIGHGDNPLIVRNTYSGTSGLAGSGCLLRVAGMNGAASNGAGFGQTDGTGIVFSSEVTGDTLVVAPGTNRILIGSAAYPGGALAYDGNGGLAGNIGMTGRLGVGTAAPDASTRLEVHNSSSVYPAVTSSSGDAAFKFNAGGSDVYLGVLPASGGAAGVLSLYIGGVVLSASSTQVATLVPFQGPSVTTTGNVTVGGQAKVGVLALTDAATVTWNANSGAMATLLIGSNRTLANISNVRSGSTYLLRVTQDGTGNRTLAYDTAYKWAGGTAPTLSTSAGAVDVLTFACFDGTNLAGTIVNDVR